MSTNRFGLPPPGRWLVVAAVGAAAAFVPRAAISSAQAGPSLPDVIESVVQPRIVKVYGVGGLRGLEAYQSGFLISPAGHVLTAWSYVLDTEFITATLNDGRRRQADLVGADPALGVAVLKIDVRDSPYFDLSKAVSLEAGDDVLALSNLFGIAAGNEAASVLHGRVSAKTTLAARRGAFRTTHDGPIYVLDAMTNNPGAAGGALTNLRGELAAMLGKELRSSLDNTWLNYAVPISELVESVDDILSGKVRPRRQQDQEQKPSDPLTLTLLGIVLIPDVLPRTPPFIDHVRSGSPADQAGVRPDDLVLFANDRTVGSCKELVEELSRIDRIDEARLVVQRDQQLIEVGLAAP